jgi:hypothetical protein
MTTTDTYYRIVGDLTVKGKTATNGITRGKKVDISYGNKKTTNFENISIIQSRQPLTPESPYFIVEVHKCGKKNHIYLKIIIKKTTILDTNAILSVGIAPLDIIDSHSG